MIKDFMKNFFFEEESTLADEPQTPILNQEPEPEIMTFTPVQEVKETKVEPVKNTPFLNVDEPKKTSLRVKRQPVKANAEYDAVMSPIFGNTDAAFDKVHNAIELPEVVEAVDYVQVVSPMFGKQVRKVVPKAQPEKAVVLQDMLEAPKEEKVNQSTLFDKKK